MAFGIYKPGQGYWVRVLSATFAGVILLAATAWLWNQLERTANALPKAGWVLVVSPAQGTAAPGQPVVLLGDPARPGEPPPELGMAVVESAVPTSTGYRLTVRDLKLSSGDPALIKRVAPAPGSAATLAGQVSGVPQGKPLVEPLYVQAAGVGVLLLAGAILIFWLVGVSPKVVEFLIATDGEMKKVNWSSRRDIMGSTWVVILWSFLIAGGLFVVDLAFSKFFQLLGVLQQ